MEHPLHHGRHLEAADEESEWLRLLRSHNLTAWNEVDVYDRSDQTGLGSHLSQ